MMQSNHEIANHSFSHPNLSLLPIDQVKKEIINCNNEIYSISGKYPLYFRPPGGNYSHYIHEVITSLNLTTIFWDINAADYESQYQLSIKGEYKSNHSAEILNQRIVSQVKPGSIILMHTSFDHTVRYLEQIIRETQKNGFQFVTISELLQE